jgi:hypothetical protein
MSADERWAYLVQLDDDLLKGGVITSERSAFLIRNADLAFVHEAYLASLLTAVAAIESHLRGENPDGGGRLVDLIDSSELESELKTELNVIRRFRNSWVHIDAPWDDSALLENPEQSENELFEMARRSLIALRKTVYSNPYI